MLHSLRPPDSGFFPLDDGERHVDGRIYDCPLDEQHYRGTYRNNCLHLILPSSKLPSIFWTWGSECLITGETAELFAKDHLSGYRLAPVVITRIKRGETPLSSIPPIYPLRPQGWAGLARQESGVKLISRCSGCGWNQWTIPTNPGMLVDESQWDGSDFSIVWPLPSKILISEQVVELVRKYRLRQAVVNPLFDLKFVWHTLSPGSLTNWFDKERAEELGGPLGIL